LNILTFNCGSSSLTFKVFSVDEVENIQVVYPERRTGSL